ncbi:Transmembrane protein 181 [Mytilus coruscus]|uniref:Transmembrane protein 181 n=1 Tax=Mytilus coruscus TaxID=42192 RepID=A0A6J8DG69_MYTCO|nr:Transmembrane protein 181 [Mytilus coruscus]
MKQKTVDQLDCKKCIKQIGLMTLVESLQHQKGITPTRPEKINKSTFASRFRIIEEFKEKTDLWVKSTLLQVNAASTAEEVEYGCQKELVSTIQHLYRDRTVFHLHLLSHLLSHPIQQHCKKYQQYQQLILPPLTPPAIPSSLHLVWVPANPRNAIEYYTNLQVKDLDMDFNVLIQVLYSKFEEKFTVSVEIRGMKADDEGVIQADNPQLSPKIHNRTRILKCSKCVFGHSLRKFTIRDWSIEQRWMSLLLPLLLLYNDPIFPLTFLVNSWVPGMFDALFQASFLCGLLLFWLCIYHGVRQTDRRFMKFYIPKLLIVGLIWISAVTLSSWQEYNEIQDPTYYYRLDTTNFMVCYYHIN